MTVRLASTSCRHDRHRGWTDEKRRAATQWFPVLCDDERDQRLLGGLKAIGPARGEEVLPMSDYLPDVYVRFREHYPDVARALDGLGEATEAAGGLDARTQRLVKLGIAIGALAEGAVRSSVRKARTIGITDDEIRQTACARHLHGRLPKGGCRHRVDRGGPRLTVSREGPHSADLPRQDAAHASPTKSASRSPCCRGQMAPLPRRGPLRFR